MDFFDADSAPGGAFKFSFQAMFVQASNPITYLHSKGARPHWDLKYSRLAPIAKTPEALSDLITRGDGYKSTLPGAESHEFIYLCTYFGEELRAAKGKAGELQTRKHLIRESIVPTSCPRRLSMLPRKEQQNYMRKSNRN